MKKGQLESHLLVLVTLALVAFGLVMVYSSTSAPAALVPLFARGLLHQDPAHRLGGGCEEMPAIGK